MTEIEKEYYRRLALQEEYGGTDKPINRITPLVSVVTITYQHAPYIRQCLDSILMQETDFPFELIIGEDGSTDGTREICIEYANKYPDKIRLFLRDRKLTQYVTKDGRTVRFNGHFSRAAARGEYIAICEGDDYWIEKNKIKLQAHYLDKNEKAVGCCTDYMIIDENGTISYVQNKKDSTRIITLRDMIISNAIGTLTIMFKKNAMPLILPEPLIYLWYGDKCLWSILLGKGPIAIIPKITSVYRRHKDSVSNNISLARIENDAIIYINYFQEKSSGMYLNAIRTYMAIIYSNLSNKFFINRRYLDALKYFTKSLESRISSKTYASQIMIVLDFIILPLYRNRDFTMAFRNIKERAKRLAGIMRFKL